MEAVRYTYSFILAVYLHTSIHGLVFFYILLS